MARKTAKQTKKAKKVPEKKTTRKTAPKKSLALKPPAFGVSIQKVLEKMKAIVNGGKEDEFLKRCAALGEDRFVTTNARLVKLVKDFEAEHDLSQAAPAITSIAMEADATSDDETCFKK